MRKQIYGGKYEVSDDGTIYSNVSSHGPKPLVGKVTNWGYRMVVLTVDGKKLYKNVHRLVAEAFIPNPENKRTINHIDGNKLNNCVQNLEWATTRENVCHARDALGTKSAKISMEIANQLRAEYATTHISQRQLAKKYGLQHTEVGYILRNKRWCA